MPSEYKWVTVHAYTTPCHTYARVTAPHIHMSHCALLTCDTYDQRFIHIWYKRLESHSTSYVYASLSTHASLHHTYTCVTAPHIRTIHCATHTQESLRHTYTGVTVHFLHMVHVIRESFGIIWVCLSQYTWVTVHVCNTSVPHIHMRHCATHIHESLRHTYTWVTAPYIRMSHGTPLTYDTGDQRVIRYHNCMPLRVHMSHCATHTHASLHHTYTRVTAPHIRMSHGAIHTHESRCTSYIWYMWSESDSVSQLYASWSTHESLRHTYTCLTVPHIRMRMCGTVTHVIGLFCKRALQKRPIFCERDPHTYAWGTAPCIHMSHSALLTYDAYDQRVIRYHMCMPLREASQRLREAYTQRVIRYHMCMPLGTICVCLSEYARVTAPYKWWDESRCTPLTYDQMHTYTHESRHTPYF